MTLALNAELNAKIASLETQLKVSGEKVDSQEDLIQIYRDSIA
jgi:hypothetical protein